MSLQGCGKSTHMQAKMTNDCMAKRNLFDGKFYVKSFLKRKMNVMRQIKLIPLALANTLLRIRVYISGKIQKENNCQG